MREAGLFLLGLVPGRKRAEAPGSRPPTWHPLPLPRPSECAPKVTTAAGTQGFEKTTSS